MIVEQNALAHATKIYCVLLEHDERLREESLDVHTIAVKAMASDLSSWVLGGVSTPAEPEKKALKKVSL
jgi:hypothetical protein